MNGIYPYIHSNFQSGDLSHVCPSRNLISTNHSLPFQFWSSFLKIILSLCQSSIKTPTTMINSVLQKIIFRPPQCTYFNDPRTIIWLTTKSKEHIPAKYIPYKGFVFSYTKIWLYRATKTILFSHGNAEDMGSCEQWVNYLSKQLKVCLLNRKLFTIR